MTTRASVNGKATLLSGLLACVLAAALAACGASADTDTSAAGPPQKGGSLTVLEDEAFSGSYPTGLDPATNTTGGANI